MERYVTISVDDGHPTDLRTADLLDKYGLGATFYIPARNPERPVMSAPQIREISTRFEVGGHTMNHVPLRFLPQVKAWSEVNDGKTWLENLLGRRIISFCYPRGKFNARTAALVKEAGFIGARTCLLNLCDFPQNPYYWGVSTHAAPQSKSIELRHALLEQNFKGAWNFFHIFKGSTMWQPRFLSALDYVEVYGGIAHLYLHSWEIDKAAEWQKLESTFQSIYERKSLSRVSNGSLFEMWNVRHNATTKEGIFSFIRN
jgi:peptidoglycan-N-acetylglucosamine deacetylase